MKVALVVFRDEIAFIKVIYLRKGEEKESFQKVWFNKSIRIKKMSESCKLLNDLVFCKYVASLIKLVVLFLCHTKLRFFVGMKRAFGVQN